MAKRTKDTLGDLNSHLFAELERLGDEDLKRRGFRCGACQSERDGIYCHTDSNECEDDPGGGEVPGQ